MSDTFYPGRGDGSPDAVRARMAEFCDWFGVEPIKIKVRAGQVYMTNDLIQWFQETGASIDWICFGEAKGMAATFREKYAQPTEEKELLALISEFSEAEMLILIDGLKAHQDGQISFEEALAQTRQKITEHRQGVAA